MPDTELPEWHTKPMDTRWVWIKKDGKMDLARATLTADAEWPEEVRDKPVAALIHLRKGKDEDLTEYICTNAEAGDRKVSYAVDSSGALAISWNDEVRLIYAPGSWLKVTLPNGRGHDED